MGAPSALCQQCVRQRRETPTMETSSPKGRHAHIGFPAVCSQGRTGHTKMTESEEGLRGGATPSLQCNVGNLLPFASSYWVKEIKCHDRRKVPYTRYAINFNNYFNLVVPYLFYTYTISILYLYILIHKKQRQYRCNLNYTGKYTIFLSDLIENQAKYSIHTKIIINHKLCEVT